MLTSSIRAEICALVDEGDLVPAHLRRRRGVGDAGAVDRQPQRSEVSLDHADGLSQVVGHGHVDRHGHTGAPQSLDLGPDAVQSRARPVDTTDIRTHLGQPERDPSADPAGGTGDQCRPVGQPEVGCGRGRFSC